MVVFRVGDAYDNKKERGKQHGEADSKCAMAPFKKEQDIFRENG